MGGEKKFKTATERDVYYGSNLIYWYSDELMNLEYNK